MHIARAKPEDAATLTSIAFAAKRHWGYPEKWIEIWPEELTVSQAFIANNETYTAIVDCLAVGFYALVRKGEKLELLRLWVFPDAMGRGIGRSLFMHCVERAKVLGGHSIEIESDPNAEGFYRRMGSHRIGVSISKVDGQRRELPILKYELP